MSANQYFGDSEHLSDASPLQAHMAQLEDDRRNATLGVYERLGLMPIIIPAILFILLKSQGIDVILIILLFAPYPPLMWHCRWLILPVLMSKNVLWKTEWAAAFAAVILMAAIDWEYAVDKVKNARGIVI